MFLFHFWKVKRNFAIFFSLRTYLVRKKNHWSLCTNCNQSCCTKSALHFAIRDQARMLIGITPFYLKNADGFNWRIPGYECSFIISISIQGSLAPKSRVLIEEETITLHKSLVWTLLWWLLSCPDEGNNCWIYFMVWFHSIEGTISKSYMWTIIAIVPCRFHTF